MLKQAYRQGIQAVVIAPHYSYQFMEERPENFGKTEVKSTADYGGSTFILIEVMPNVP